MIIIRIQCVSSACRRRLEWIAGSDPGNGWRPKNISRTLTATPIKHVIVVTFGRALQITAISALTF
jgi:hypothetical protein